MSAATLPAPKLELLMPPMPVLRFTVAQYHDMIRNGILTEDHRVELLDGWIVPKMPHNPAHDGTIWQTQTHLLRLVPQQWLLRVQSAITTKDSEPEPDVVIARWRIDGYGQSHPKPEEIGLIIEVADSTLEADRKIKAELYARARIPVYWIINVVEMQVEVHSQPQRGRSPKYRQVEVYERGQKLPLILGDQTVCEIEVDSLFSQNLLTQKRV